MGAKRQAGDTLAHFLKAFAVEVGLIAHWTSTWGQRPMPEYNCKVALHAYRVERMGTVGPSDLFAAFFSTSAQAQVANIAVEGMLQPIPRPFEMLHVCEHWQSNAPNRQRHCSMRPAIGGGVKPKAARGVRQKDERGPGARKHGPADKGDVSWLVR